MRTPNTHELSDREAIREVANCAPARWPAAATSDATRSSTSTAGNVGYAWCDYEVGVELDRLIRPTPNISTIVKANRTVPIQWRAVDFYGQPVSDPSHFVGVDSASTACVRGRLDMLNTVSHQGLQYRGKANGSTTGRPLRKRVVTPCNCCSSEPQARPT